MVTVAIQWRRWWSNDDPFTTNSDNDSFGDNRVPMDVTYVNIGYLLIIKNNAVIRDSGANGSPMVPVSPMTIAIWFELNCYWNLLSMTLERVGKFYQYAAINIPIQPKMPA